MIPDYCEAIIAYRCWDVFPNGLLCGQTVQEPWPVYQPMVARCATTGNQWVSSSVSIRTYDAHLSSEGHWIDAPVLPCECGIYAYKTADAAQGRVFDDLYGGGPYFSGRPKGRAWGALQLWGKLVEHVEGYRAQFAYPSSLFCEDAQLAAKIARLYGVACELKMLDRPKREETHDDSALFSCVFGGTPGYAGHYYTAYRWLTPLATAPTIQQHGPIQSAQMTDLPDVMAKAFHKSASEISEKAE